MSAESTTAEKDYEVGYGKPPKSGQFKKGQSGNPRGGNKTARARNAKLATFGDHLSDAMRQTVEVEENGKRVILTLLHLAIRTRVNAAAKGDLQALRELLKLSEIKDSGPISPGKRFVFTLDEADAVGRPRGEYFYDPNVVIVRAQKPGAREYARGLSREDEMNRHRQSAADLIELEMGRQVSVVDPATGAPQLMTMREVIAKRLARLFTARKPGAYELMIKLNKQVRTEFDRTTYIGVPWDFVMPPRCDRKGRPIGADPEQAPASSPVIA